MCVLAMKNLSVNILLCQTYLTKPVFNIQEVSSRASSFNWKERDTLLWFAARCFRIIASVFGEIFRHKALTPQDNLVLRLLSRSFPVQLQNGVSIMRQLLLKNTSNVLALWFAQLVYGQCVTIFLGATPDWTIYDLLHLNSHMVSLYTT